MDFRGEKNLSSLTILCVFILKQLGKVKRRLLISANHAKFKFQCPQIKLYQHTATLIHFHTVRGDFCNVPAKHRLFGPQSPECLLSLVSQWKFCCPHSNSLAFQPSSVLLCGLGQAASAL